MVQKGKNNTWQVRQTELKVDLRSIKHNLLSINRRNKSADVLAVLKSDAYGHGAIPIAKYLEKLPDRFGLHGYGVANVEEGLEFRKSKIHKPVYIMSGIQSPNEDLYRCLVTCELTPIITSISVLKHISRLAKSIRRPLRIHIKFDTGMNRLGIPQDATSEVLRIISHNPLLIVEGILSHYAAAEFPTKTATKKQTKNFREIVKFFGNHLVLPKYTHMANSAASQFNLYPEGNLVRTGLQLFGEGDSSLKPVATWEAQVYDTKSVAKGEGIGYGPIFRAKRDMKVAVLGVGYADGYRRSLSNRADVLIKGQRCPVVGAISMDLVTVDISKIGRVSSSTKAILLGKQDTNRITASDLAKKSDSIPYEILTGISSRVPRNYLE